ncbi:MAG: addiction module component [Candidatus Moranbacteria bacterium]|nr:addiction module component [Candidatus Moranbacteria bacterium]
MNKKEFLGKYNINEEDFEKTKIKWSDLMAIRKDYEKYKKKLNPIAKYIAENLGEVESVCYVRHRVKRTDDLIAKIIRKKIKDPNRKNVTVKNYKRQITDLIGIRALHLLKKDWESIGDFILKNWELYETPNIKMRKGDNVSYYSKAIESGKYRKEEHKESYRSVHFLIQSRPDKEMYVSEIQVRTIFEEAWSEIDHKVRYPNDTDDELVNRFLKIFNNLAGSADEMGSYVVSLKENLKENEKEKTEKDERLGSYEKKIKALERKIERLNVSPDKKNEIISGIDDLKGSLKILMSDNIDMNCGFVNIDSLPFEEDMENEAHSIEHEAHNIEHETHNREHETRSMEHEARNMKHKSKTNKSKKNREENLKLKI